MITWNFKRSRYSFVESCGAARATDKNLCHRRDVNEGESKTSHLQLLLRMMRLKTPTGNYTCNFLALPPVVEQNSFVTFQSRMHGEFEKKRKFMEIVLRSYVLVLQI